MHNKKKESFQVNSIFSQTHFSYFEKVKDAESKLQKFDTLN
jgi:hypothetical protein